MTRMTRQKFLTSRRVRCMGPALELEPIDLAELI